MEEALVCSEIRILTCSIYVFLISHEPFYVVWTFYEQKIKFSAGNDVFDKKNVIFP